MRPLSSLKSIEDELFSDFIIKGNPESFNELFALINPWLTKCIYRITLDMEAAKDIEQDAWIKLLNIDFKRSKGKVRNLIFTIAKNEALMWKRRNNYEQEYLENEYKQHEPQNNILKLIHQDDTRNLVTNAIKQLEENYQDVIILYYLAEMKISDISLMLERPENTIKTWLKRAKERLFLIMSPIFDKELSN